MEEPDLLPGARQKDTFGIVCFGGVGVFGF